MGHVANGRCFACDGRGYLEARGSATVAAAPAAFDGALSAGTAVTIDGQAAVIKVALASGRYSVKFDGRAGTRFVDASEVSV